MSSTEALTSLVSDGRTEFREDFAEVGDVRLHYVEAGEGPLVVLLHGFPEFWYGWRLQIEPLAAAVFRVVAPDTRGYNLVLLLLRPPGPARGCRARRPLALLPALPARRPPRLHAKGDRTLHRGVVAAR